MVNEKESSNKEVIVHIQPLTEQGCLSPARGAAILGREEVTGTVPSPQIYWLTSTKLGDSVTAAGQRHPKMLLKRKHLPLPVRRALRRREAGGRS